MRKVSGKQPSIKNSFWKLYSKTIKAIAKIIGLIVIATGMYTILYKLYKKYYLYIIAILKKILPYLPMFILCTIVVIFIAFELYRYIAFLLNQRRIPLTSLEIDALNLKTPQEYGEYLEKYLYRFCPRKDILYRILISATNYYDLRTFKNKKYNLEDIFECSIDLKDEAIFDIDIEIKCKNYIEFRILMEKIFSNNNHIVHTIRYVMIRNSIRNSIPNKM